MDAVLERQLTEYSSQLQSYRAYAPHFADLAVQFLSASENAALVFSLYEESRASFSSASQKYTSRVQANDERERRIREKHATFRPAVEALHLAALERWTSTMSQIQQAESAIVESKQPNPSMPPQVLSFLSHKSAVESFQKLLAYHYRRTAIYGEMREVDQRLRHMRWTTIQNVKTRTALLPAAPSLSSSASSSSMISAPYSHMPLQSSSNGSSSSSSSSSSGNGSALHVSKTQSSALNHANHISHVPRPLEGVDRFGVHNALLDAAVASIGKTVLPHDKVPLYTLHQGGVLHDLLAEYLRLVAAHQMQQSSQ